jgi:hypothetical protein
MKEDFPKYRIAGIYEKLVGEVYVGSRSFSHL